MTAPSDSETSVDVKPRSRDVTDGIQKAASRSMLRAVGLTDDDWEKPQVGIASSWNEITPCNMSIRRLTEAAKDGVRRAWVAGGMDPSTAAGMAETIEVADVYPAFWRLLPGPEGSLWVQRPRPADELTDAQREAFDVTIHLGSDTWWVFDADGRFVGAHEFPAGFQALHYGDGRFWGVALDEFDVQRVAVLHVRR